MKMIKLSHCCKCPRPLNSLSLSLSLSFPLSLFLFAPLSLYPSIPSLYLSSYISMAVTVSHSPLLSLSLSPSFYLPQSFCVIISRDLLSYLHTPTSFYLYRSIFAIISRDLLPNCSLIFSMYYAGQRKDKNDQQKSEEEKRD